jgi:hypothetical protein
MLRKVNTIWFVLWLCEEHENIMHQEGTGSINVLKQYTSDYVMRNRILYGHLSHSRENLFVDD